MKLVILHHHLNRGGVTSVIENHLRSLATLPEVAQPEDVTIVFGGRDSGWNAGLLDELPFECTLVVVPEIEYDNFRSTDSSLQHALLQVLNGCSRDSTVLHVHNHSLGKNSQLAATIGQLADDGWHMLLQVHDFAEDLRPSNYQHLVHHASSVEQMQSELYPQASQIQYSVLNQRDLVVLRTAGLSEERLHLLPNPVQESAFSATPEQIATTKSQLARELNFPASDAFVLYPVRPIRRKNLGEFLLWSLLAHEATFAMTLAPLNPHEQDNYRHWVDLATDLELPVRFEIAKQTDLEFSAVYSAADAILTTSVAEGFGLVYLEAALARKQLVGRNLPSVCRDFESAGMKFPGLREEMRIPTSAIDVSTLQASHRRHLLKLREQYGLPPGNEDEVALDDLLRAGDTVDFGRLELSQQTDFLQRAAADATLRETVRELNPHIGQLQAARDEDALHTKNGRVISEHYSPEVIGRKLGSIYRQLLACHPSEVLRQRNVAKSVLNSFVHPSQLFPLRLES